MGRYHRLSRLATAASAAFALAGCAGTPLEFVRDQPGANFQRYMAVVIKEFENGVGTELPAQIPLQLQVAAEVHLGKCYPGLLRITPKPPTDASDLLVVEGTITEYREGSKFARFMLIGLGSSKFASDVVFRDGQTGHELARAKVDLLWAMGGIVGAMTGIEDLVKKAGAQVADAIAEKKGVTKAEGCEG